MRRVAWLAGAAAVAALGARRAEAGAPEFRPSLYGQYRRKGEHTVVGRLAVLLPNGLALAKPGAPAFIIPDTPYSRWWLSTSASQINARSGPDAFADVPVPDRLRPFARYAICDADGNFEFNDLPTGRFLIRGHLSVALPRTVVATPRPIPSDAADSQGPPTHRTVFDYVYVWLDSESLRVGNGPPPDVAFHLVARRDQVARHV